MNPVAEKIIRGSVSLPGDSDLVMDADEEVFLLYSSLQAKDTPDSTLFRGLGHVDSRKDILTVTFELKAFSGQPKTEAPSLRTPRKHRHSKNTKTQKSEKISSKTVEIELAQDKTALRTRKGDTGSVLWRASIDLAQLVLQQIYDHSANSLLNPTILNTQHILELGAGTGLLAAAFSHLVQRYTVTDISALTPLLRKNIGLNFSGWPKNPPLTPGSNIFVEELDWVLLHSMTPTQRSKNFSFEPVDILLIVDCIYHPSLLPALVDTIGYLAIPGRTVVLVIVELRAEDVIREFLEQWIAQGGWEIYRAGSGLLEKPYAMWLGWRKES
ncbi:putative methyltransferase-domain-containing protein [Collybia nuda]|uniref:Methyltransferase-domain-containing protein n=1 Tax=Collybia nuda TaxID=64659 RepID=A0A9P5Y1F8_9AGAR|nr:putative methyltransferase-domain-containing protein [Collybia nuda]